MSRNNPFIWAAALLLLVIQVSLASPALPPIINVHESIEELADVVNLQQVMQGLNIRTTVLHAIPEGLLYYKGDDVSLNDVDASNTLVEQVVAQTKGQDDFEFFCTVDPLDVTRTETLQNCLDLGAKGLKLYNGYSYSHVLPLDDARLSDLYTMLEQKGALLMLPVNAGEFKDELENVLTLHPALNVICPHYCLSSKSLNRLTDLMEAHPNLYVDTSFGSTDFALDGFKTISENKEAYEAFFDAFQDRILFATDNVVTSYEDKDHDFLKDLYQDYIWVLSKDHFNSEVVGNTQAVTLTAYTGLDLPYTTLQKVFWKNWMDLVQ